ncbi:hypothetical protein [Burkholderia gladioli]|uniref:hypothetical protein n=1 Tax=Burkholderia gladioli TaxID=28095 RepID=UPI000AA007B2|nr:hypothetical protein [Burkholderia gladioli]
MHKSHATKPQRIDIHRDFLANLKDHEIYSLILLGHINNEITTLMRTMELTFPKNEQTMIEKSGSFHLIQFFAKLLCGKIFEANEKIYQKHVQDFIKKWCVPYDAQKIIESLSLDFKKTFKSSKWLTKARNRHAMHYPKLEEWTEAIQYTKTQNFDIIVGSSQNEILFRTADVAAFLAFSLDVDNTDALIGIKRMASEIGPLALSLSKFTAQCLKGFIQASNSANPKKKYAKHKEGKSFKTINFDDFEIPYFFNFNPKSSQTPKT